MLRKLIPAVLVALMPLTGCSGGGDTEESKTAQEAPAAAADKSRSAEPDFIAVQHILIGFEGSVPGKPITRTQQEAEKLAIELFERAKSGEDFDALVAEHTDDSAPGIYKIANFNAEADMSQLIYPRAQMVQAFGDVGFPLDVGEIGLATFDPATSKYGWHIIKRVE